MSATAANQVLLAGCGSRVRDVGNRGWGRLYLRVPVMGRQSSPDAFTRIGDTRQQPTRRVDHDRLQEEDHLPFL
jgi:hypothetical protein